MKESKVKDENYCTIQGWMSTKLKLKGNELIIFAIIYGFSQAENQKFTGSLQYLVDWTNSSKQSCINNLKSLIDKELIIKEEEFINGIKYCSYSINFNGIKKILIPIKKTLINNIDNNIELLDNKLSNNEKTETTSFNDINKELKEKQKEQKKAKKIQDAILIDTMLDNFTTNEEVKSCLKEYLKVRRKKGLTPEQWKIILEDLRKECRTDKNYAIEKINKAIAGGWMQIVYIENFKGKPKTSYSSKPTFDNTASHNVPKGIASMNKQEKNNFIENELARDENGNLLKF